MSSMQIIEAFKQLPLLERQAVLEKILQLEGKKPTIKRYLTCAEKHSRLAAGAAAMQTEYQHNKELTIFTDQNTDDIYKYETR